MANWRRERSTKLMELANLITAAPQNTTKSTENKPVTEKSKATFTISGKQHT